MSAFREFMLKEYPYYENAGPKNVEMWQQIFYGGIKQSNAEILVLLAKVKSVLYKNGFDETGDLVKTIEQKLSDV